MSRSEKVRSAHRWMSVAFTLAVVVNMIAMGFAEPPPWVYLLALLPLAMLQCTGLYLLVAPYVARWRSRRRTGAGCASPMQGGR